MRDVYVESVVPAQVKMKDIILMILLAVLAGIFAVLVVLYKFFFVFPAMVCAFMAYFVYQRFKSEYEYVHTNNCFDVDIVISGERRKCLKSVNLSKVILIAPEDSEEARIYRTIQGTDYSGVESETPVYIMVYYHNNTKEKLKLRLDMKMYESLRSWLPGKVK